MSNLVGHALNATKLNRPAPLAAAAAVLILLGAAWLEPWRLLEEPTPSPSPISGKAGNDGLDTPGAGARIESIPMATSVGASPAAKANGANSGPLKAAPRTSQSAATPSSEKPQASEQPPAGDAQQQNFETEVVQTTTQRRKPMPQQAGGTVPPACESVVCKPVRTTPPYRQ